MEPPPLGTVIRRHRTRRQMKQQDLADAIGLSHDGQPRISDLERGKATPSLAEVRKIEDALNLTPGTILVDAGYVTLPKTTSAMIGMDPALAPGWRTIVLRTYDTAVAGSANADSWD